MASIRCSCLRIEHRILKRPKIVAGTGQLPRTRTSRVPNLIYQLSISGKANEGDGTITSFIKAMAWIAMRSEDGDLVAEILQAYCCIDDQTFSAANAKIWVEEDDIIWSGRHDREYYCQAFSGITRDDLPSASKWKLYPRNTHTEAA